MSSEWSIIMLSYFIIYKFIIGNEDCVLGLFGIAFNFGVDISCGSVVYAVYAGYVESFSSGFLAAYVYFI